MAPYCQTGRVNSSWTASPWRRRHYNPSKCHKINTCPLVGHDISEDLILVDNSPSSCTKVWRYNRKSYAYSKSLHEQCQKTTLYMHWGSGLLRGDNKETLTIVGIYINTENQERQRSQKWKPQTPPRTQLTHTDVAEMSHCIVTVTWGWRQHVLRTLYYVPPTHITWCLIPDRLHSYCCEYRKYQLTFSMP